MATTSNPPRLIHGDPKKVLLLHGVQLGLQAFVASHRAAIAQLGERQTEDLKVPGSIPGLGMAFAC